MRLEMKKNKILKELLKVEKLLNESEMEKDNLFLKIENLENDLYQANKDYEKLEEKHNFLKSINEEEPDVMYAGQDPAVVDGDPF